MKRAWLYQCCWLRIETIDNTHICMKRMKRSSLFVLLYVIVPACNKDWERTRVCVEFKVGDGIKFHASDWSTQNDTWMKHCINLLLNSDQLPYTTTTLSSFPPSSLCIECEGWRRHSSLIYLILLFTKSNIDVSGWLYQNKTHFFKSVASILHTLWL